MQISVPVKLIFYSILLAPLAGCVPEGVMHTWSPDQKLEEPLQNLMVMGLVNNVNLRNDVETEVLFASRNINLKAANSMSMFPPELGKPFDDIERVKARLREKGFDSILTVALINIDAARYVPPETSYEPLVYYDRFRNYYFKTYDLVYRPGYYAPLSRYYIETNLYELKGGGLIWSGRSKVFDHGTLPGFLPIYSKGLFRELVMDGAVVKQ